MRPVRLVALALAAAALTGCASSTKPVVIAGGDAKRGKAAMERYGCGNCHQIPGIHRASGRIGPPLGDFRDRRLIAGEIANSPQNAIRWIMHPKRIEPRTVMPDLGVGESDARDIVAYLYNH